MARAISSKVTVFDTCSKCFKINLSVFRFNSSAANKSAARNKDAAFSMFSEEMIFFSHNNLSLGTQNSSAAMNRSMVSSNDSNVAVAVVVVVLGGTLALLLCLLWRECLGCLDPLNTKYCIPPKNRYVVHSNADVSTKLDPYTKVSYSTYVY